MERFKALGRATQLMLVGAVLLFIDLLLPWQDFAVLTFNGWRGVGVILGLLTIVLLAWLIVRLAAVNIPLPVSTAMTAALIGTSILIFAVIKILTILGDEATVWAWIGLVLAVVIAAGAWMEVQTAGGMDKLKSEASSFGSSGGAGATAAAAPAAPAAAAAPQAYEPAGESAETPAEAAGAEEADTDSPSTERDT